jgi:hypothetical protein
VAKVRLSPHPSPTQARREAQWLAATESGISTATLAEATGLSRRAIQLRIARARQARGETPETSATPEASELPRLVLTDSETRGTTPKPDGWAYSLATDSVSLDGGSTWISADSPDTPRLPVLVSDRNGRGLRKHRLEPRPYQTPPEPPGPTSYRPRKGLRGGCGSS